jgi:type III restriction enzyme
MSRDSRIYKNDELVLQVPTDIDPRIWNEDPYEPFIDMLCRDREYQKEAIVTCLRYLAGRKFASLSDLAEWNFGRSDALQAKYNTMAGFLRHLQLPNSLSCSIDLATGTGKSYVMYGIAAIMLAEGLVDRVLLLCPSRTIEAGLLEKFRQLAGDAALGDLLPASSKFRFPSISSAAQSIVKGAICIENYHAVLQHVSSSIKDSLSGNGSRTLVLNDEAHHVANVVGTDARRWKEFLSNPMFGFRYVVGLSGTCYIGNDYFSDVVFRYSLRQAIEEKFVKRVEYVAEMPETTAADERWQLVHQRHTDNKHRLKSRQIKPLTIVVTADIRSCKQTAAELSDFLKSQPDYAGIDTAMVVLPVTSASEHQPSIPLLRRVDDVASPVEYVVSVAMLSEGWDVKNVFQIVPHEERAFDSKLLISQILGRGLRRPEPWSGADPIVTVFNHDAWSARIKHLVNEVLEIERRVTCRCDPASEFNFDLHTLDYTRVEDVTQYAKKGEYRLFESGYVELPTQVEAEDVAIGYVDAISEKGTAFKAVIQHKTWSAADVARQMYERLRGIDEESRDAENADDRTSYASRFPLEECEKIVAESLKRAHVTSGRVIDANRQRFMQALGTLRRKGAKRVVYKTQAGNLWTLSTSERPSDSVSAAELRKGLKTIFFTGQSADKIPDEQREFFAEATDPDGEFAQGQVQVQNPFDFKTPLTFVIADATPERRFVRELVKRENALKIDAWIKNTATRFYTVEFAWKKGEHPKRGEFSPDFFIRQGNCCIVVEIKSDDEIADPSPENVKKYQFARTHFETLNGRLEADGQAQRYHFTILTPRGYNTFFQTLREQSAAGFLSELDVALRARMQGA